MQIAVLIVIVISTSVAYLRRWRHFLKGRISEKDLVLCKETVKNEYGEFDHRGTLTWKQKCTDTKNAIKTTTNKQKKNRTTPGKTDRNKND